MCCKKLSWLFRVETYRSVRIAEISVAPSGRFPNGGFARICWGDWVGTNKTNPCDFDSIKNETGHNCIIDPKLEEVIPGIPVTCTRQSLIEKIKLVYAREPDDAINNLPEVYYTGMSVKSICKDDFILIDNVDNNNNTVKFTCNSDGDWEFDGRCGMTIKFVAIDGSTTPIIRNFSEQDVECTGSTFSYTGEGNGAKMVCMIGDTIVGYEGDTTGLRSPEEFENEVLDNDIIKLTVGNTAPSVNCHPYFLTREVIQQQEVGVPNAYYPNESEAQKYNAIKNGGEVELKCIDGYAVTTEQPKAICNNGNWEFKGKCIKVCKGKPTLISNATMTDEDLKSSLGYFYTNGENSKNISIDSLNNNTLNNIRFEAAEGSILNAGCESTYVEIKDKGNCIDSDACGNKTDELYHHYICVDGEWKYNGSCIQGCKRKPVINNKEIMFKYTKLNIELNEGTFYSDGTAINKDENSKNTKLENYIDSDDFIAAIDAKIDAVCNTNYSESTDSNGTLYNNSNNNNNQVGGHYYVCKVNNETNISEWQVVGFCGIKVDYVSVTNENNKIEKVFKEGEEVKCDTSSFFNKDPGSGNTKRCKINDTIVGYEKNKNGKVDSFVVSFDTIATDQCHPYDIIMKSGFKDPGNRNSSKSIANNMDYGIECNSGYHEIVKPKVTCNNGNWNIEGLCVAGCKGKPDLITGSNFIQNGSNYSSNGTFYQIGNYNTITPNTSNIDSIIAANGSMLDAGCSSEYTEVSDGGNCHNCGNKSSSWGHYYYCDNGTWKYSGGCSMKGGEGTTLTFKDRTCSKGLCGNNDVYGSITLEPFKHGEHRSGQYSASASGGWSCGRDTVYYNYDCTCNNGELKCSNTFDHCDND